MRALHTLRADLLAVAKRRADRADRLLAEAGATQGLVEAYKAVAEAFAVVGHVDLARMYRVRAKRTAEFVSANPVGARRMPRPTTPIADYTTPRCPDRSGEPVEYRPGFVPRR